MNLWIETLDRKFPSLDMCSCQMPDARLKDAIPLMRYIRKTHGEKTSENNGFGVFNTAKVTNQLQTIYV